MPRFLILLARGIVQLPRKSRAYTFDKKCKIFHFTTESAYASTLMFFYFEMFSSTVHRTVTMLHLQVCLIGSGKPFGTPAVKGTLWNRHGLGL